VYRARSHDDQQAVIGAVQNPMDIAACFVDGFGGLVADRNIAEQAGRRQ
jgi:hypothetical protein